MAGRIEQASRIARRRKERIQLANKPLESTDPPCKSTHSIISAYLLVERGVDGEARTTRGAGGKAQRGSPDSLHS